LAKSTKSLSSVGNTKTAEIAAQEKVVQLKKEEIALDAKIVKNAQEKVDNFKILEKSGQKLSDIQKKELEYAKEDLKLQEDKEKALKLEQKTLSKLYEIENKRKKLIKDSISDTSEMNDALRSMGNQIGKNNKTYEVFNASTDFTKTTLQSIGKVVNKLGDDQKDLAKQAINAADGYKNTKTSIIDAEKSLRKNKITQSEYNELVKGAYENFDTLISKIDDSSKEGQVLKRTLEGAKREMESFNKAAEKSEKMITGLNTGLDQISSSGVPAVSELSNVIKSASQGGKGLSLSIFALGAALGALAYNYGLVGNQVEDTARFDKNIAQIKGDITDFNLKLEAGAFGGRNFVVEKAMTQFSASMRQAAASFQAASKTALFGNAIGGVGYGAAQLQMAGIGADKVAAGMTAAADATGRMPSAKIGADMAIMASRTGQSEESIASINEAFMRMDGLTESGALNMQEGLRAMASQANINLGGLMTEMAESSKEMLGYQIKSGSALAKQVTFARSMGVSFADIAKAGQGMVLNYKDSIKSEMQLSAMLGKNVDLSEVRAKFASGDTEGALKALQAQGLDPAKMDMFQQQQLQQATGMDLNTLSKLSTNTGRSGGELQAGNATAGNKSFLNRTVSAQATLEATNAMISSDTAIQMNKLNTDQEVATQEAIIKNTGGIQKLMTDLKKEEGLKEATLGLKTAMYGLIAGMAALALSMGAQALFKGKMPNINPFSKGAPKVPTPSGPLTKAGTPDMRYSANKVPGASVADDVVGAGSKSGKLASVLPKLGKFAKGLGVVGTVLGAGFDYKNRKDEGQTTTQAMAGTGGGVAGGLAGAAAGAAIGSVIPVVGTAIGGIIGGALGAWGGGSLADLITGVGKKSEAKTEQKAGASSPAASAATKTVAATGGTSVTTQAKTAEKWMQDKLIYMSGNLERVVDRTHKTMMNTAATTKELQTLNTNTKAIMNLTKTIEALTVATFEGKRDVSVNIDGKRVAYAFDRYKQNVRSGEPDSPTGGGPK
jgi:shikimate kinase